jgi:hypothetical protein
MIDFLDLLCVLVVCVLIVLAYIVHLDQKVDIYRDWYNDNSYNHFDALIDDFKAVSLFIVVVVIGVMIVRGIIVILS